MACSSSDLPRIFLLPGQERRIASGHPWVYSNEVRMNDEAKALEPGTPVILCRADGKPLGVGAFNPRCLICFRMMTDDAKVTVDRPFIAGRLKRALDLRRRLFPKPYYRLVHGEADGLPGLVVDRFGDAFSVQTSTAGMERMLDDVPAAIDEVCAAKVVVINNNGAFRKLESLDSYVRVAKGTVEGPVEVHEGGVIFLADLLEGQKTGWFYDQRDNHAFVAGLCRDVRMLDIFCYGGGFAVSAAAAGAREVIAVDSSAGAIALAEKAARLNGVDHRCSFVRADAFTELERLAGAGERFGVVSADPPAFVKSRKDLKSGLKGYRKLARMAAELVEPGGFLFIASCSHNVDAETFAKEIAIGIARAERSGRIIRSSGAAADHPVHPNLPESAYLKALTLQLD
ncbi:MAG: SAM-dependent methyltransferase [Rhodospirillales bacterium RIFCSPLOWO2_12_FULL_58_28]|nr:MAG: SAM-dependent methyltransferase [Rhodospirillales bacterium RIFCSPLOWO2_02_FULL_58_16]OHC79120.1 MAG: SAM-dependent methyltransferase [Rhodospirillales bacterium RIFCSPLOWO2_12_FULL_58_28]